VPQKFFAVGARHAHEPTAATKRLQRVRRARHGEFAVEMQVAIFHHLATICR
jgi:hypothetical protein